MQPVCPASTGELAELSRQLYAILDWCKMKNVDVIQRGAISAASSLTLPIVLLSCWSWACLRLCDVTGCLFLLLSPTLVAQAVAPALSASRIFIQIISIEVGI